MRSAVSLGAALVSAALAVSMPWSAVAADAPLDGALAGGGRYIVRPLGGAPVAAIALWYRAPDAGFDATPWPGLGRLAATAVAASQPVTGTPLGAYIERLGGRITISAYPDSVEIALLVPADRATSAVQALTRSFFAPVLTDAGLDDARRTVAEEAALRGLNPSAAISDRLYGALFTAGPDAAAPFPVPTAVAAIGTATVRSYAERAFRPSNAILVASGAVTAAVMSGALRGREDAAPGTEPAVPNAVATPAPVHASAPVEGFGLAWAGPPISDEAAATACDFVADYLFNDRSDLQRLADAAGTDLDGTFVTFHDPGVFIVTASGGNAGAVRRAVAAALARLTVPLDAATFATARRAFVYRLLSHNQSADLVADNFGWYAVEGAPAYAPGEDGDQGPYLRAAAALTPAFVASVVATYLAAGGAVVDVTGPNPPPAPPAPSPGPTASAGAAVR